MITYHNHSIGKVMAWEYQAASESSIPRTYYTIIDIDTSLSSDIPQWFNIIKVSLHTFIHRGRTFLQPRTFTHVWKYSGRTPTLADMFQGNVSTSKYVSLECLSAGTNPLWHRPTSIIGEAHIDYRPWFYGRLRIYTEKFTKVMRSSVYAQRMNQRF